MFPLSWHLNFALQCYIVEGIVAYYICVLSLHLSKHFVQFKNRRKQTQKRKLPLQFKC